ncbi:MAG: SIR2 family protein [Acidihalobacter sp.]|uniref:SIR2 family protein n=1 Tax=Acidihalobacter sp. TaxID=1872108 RepID=UPI00307D9980
MHDSLLHDLIDGIRAGDIAPYLGAGALRGVTDTASGEAIPAQSEELILALNNGQPMAPRLMYEFPRAAMHVELKRGRSTVNRFLTETYANRSWTRSALHAALAELQAPYVIDINRDTQLQELYADRPHLLIHGIARIGGTDFRYKLYRYDGSAYAEITTEEADPALPVLFKPMGSPTPEPSFIASDADYVDYITELMGGFAVPAFLKRRRKGLRYLFVGLRMLRDTERMVLSDLIYANAGEPAGWALIPEPTAKEERFCARQGIEIVEADTDDLLAAIEETALAPA